MLTKTIKYQNLEKNPKHTFGRAMEKIIQEMFENIWLRFVGVAV